MYSNYEGRFEDFMSSHGRRRGKQRAEAGKGEEMEVATVLERKQDKKSGKLFYF